MWELRRSQRGDLLPFVGVVRRAVWAVFPSWFGVAVTTWLIIVGRGCRVGCGVGDEAWFGVFWEGY